VGYTTIVDRQTGQPRLVVDLRVVNEGVQPLEKLTILVRVVPADGSSEVTRRVTLDLADLRPGIGVQMSTSVPGLEVSENDEVFVEIEQGLSPEELHQLPEWRAVS
jgi:hypothetical protein